MPSSANNHAFNLGQPSGEGCAVHVQVLLLVPGKVHEVHQQERVHHVRRPRQKLLRLGQGRLLSPLEERGQAGRPHRYMRLSIYTRFFSIH